MNRLTGLIGKTTCRIAGIIGETRLTKMMGTTGTSRLTKMTGLAWITRMNRMIGISWMGKMSGMTTSLMKEPKKDLIL